MVRKLEERQAECSKLDELLEEAKTSESDYASPLKLRRLCVNCDCVTGPGGPSRYPASQDETSYKKP